MWCKDSMNALSNETERSQAMPVTGRDTNSPTSNQRGESSEEAQQTNFRHCTQQD